MNNNPRMRLTHGTAATAAAVIQGRLKMAWLMEMSEEDFEKQLKELESSRLFKLLKASGVVNLAEFPSARYAARNFAGYGLRLSAGDLPELTDGNGDLVGLIQRIGQEDFEACFLKDAEMNDAQRAVKCGITQENAARLRDFVNRAFIHSEFEGAPAPLPEKVFSAVAGIELEDGAPVLAFFNREVWKGRYRVNREKLAEYAGSLPEADGNKIEKLLKRLEFADQRKTTLYRALELLISVQTDFLVSGEPSRRRPLSQRTLAKNLGVDTSVLNRLVSNKSVQMPWGVETPMSVLLPSSKEVNLERLYSMAAEKPELSDEGLRAELKVRHGVDLSRRSVAQYRKDLNVNSAGRR